MATADQLKSLVKAHVDGNYMQFKTIVLQIAASEARQNHGKLAQELKKLVSKPVPQHASVVSIGRVSPMVELSMPASQLDDLIASNDIRSKVSRILDEYRSRKKLAGFGLQNRRKILLEGPPGTGKTFTSSIIAAELKLPLYTVQIDKITTKFMGETSAKLRQLFQFINENTGVYLFDEFDAIGSDRSLDNEVGEMRRVLNSFLQFIEEDNSESIIVAATNNQQLLDQALFRRFDDVLHYSLPKETEIRKIFLKHLEGFQPGIVVSSKLVEEAKTLSQAEIVNVCLDAIKGAILGDTTITEIQLLKGIKERKSVYLNREA